jgi:hypothetical protein
VPLIPGVVVTCRAIGILKMEDEAGEDGKVLAVPIDKKCSLYTQWQSPEDMNPLRLKTISHFFEHYKDLEEGKWVKVLGWEGPDAAKKEISTASPLTRSNFSCLKGGLDAPGRQPRTASPASRIHSRLTPRACAFQWRAACCSSSHWRCAAAASPCWASHAM